MAIYVIAFQIGVEGNAEDRYRSLVQGIESEALEDIWSEVPSIYIIRSKKSIERLSYDLHIKTMISTVYDKLVIINLSKKQYDASCGIEFLQELRSLMRSR